MTKTIKNKSTIDNTILKQLEKINRKIETLDKKVDNNTSGLKASMLQTEVKLTHLDFKIENLESHYKQFEQKMEDRYDKMMNHIDGFAKVYKKVDEDQVFSSHQIKDHEDRIEKLENTVFATA